MADLEDFDAQDIAVRIQDKFEDNKNYIYIALGIIAVAVAGFWFYNTNKEAKNAEANGLIWKQESNFSNGNFQGAIDGDINAAGYATISDEYNGTYAGDIATYNMGVSYLNLGQFQNAIATLEDVSFDDVVIGAIAKGALGDAYLELGEIDNAISSYTDAVNHNDNEFTVPVYLKKLAIAHEQVKENGKAIAAYKRIVADYPASKEAKDAAKYIAMLEAK